MMLQKQTTANSIVFTYIAASTNFRSISVSHVQIINATVNNNKVMNIIEHGTSASSVFFSIIINSSAPPLKYSLSNITIANLSSVLSSASTNALNGIYFINSFNNVNIEGNLVQNL